jgi:hypothetical protein
MGGVDFASGGQTTSEVMLPNARGLTRATKGIDV